MYDHGPFPGASLIPISLTCWHSAWKEKIRSNSQKIYYQGRGDNATTIPFPEGFKMLSGNVSARAFDNTSYVSKP